MIPHPNAARELRQLAAKAERAISGEFSSFTKRAILAEIDDWIDRRKDVIMEKKFEELARINRDQAAADAEWERLNRDDD